METRSRRGKFDPVLFSVKYGGCVTGYKHVFCLREHLPLLVLHGFGSLQPTL